MRHLIDWCTVNHVQLNTTKTKEVIIYFRKNRGDHAPLYINGDCVERVTAFKFLGVHISENLSWTINIPALTKKAQQRLHFLRVLRKSVLEQRLLVSFYQSFNLLSRVCSPIPSRRGMLGVRLETRSHYRGS